MATHYGITMGNDIAMYIHCDGTMGNDIAMCIYHGITMHNDIAMKFSKFLLYIICCIPNYDFIMCSMK